MSSHDNVDIKVALESKESGNSLYKSKEYESAVAEYTHGIDALNSKYAQTSKEIDENTSFAPTRAVSSDKPSPSSQEDVSTRKLFCDLLS